jgi:hypothetical protein
MSVEVASPRAKIRRTKPEPNGSKNFEDLSVEPQSREVFGADHIIQRHRTKFHLPPFRPNQTGCAAAGRFGRTLLGQTFEELFHPVPHQPDS